MFVGVYFENEIILNQILKNSIFALKFSHSVVYFAQWALFTLTDNSEHLAGRPLFLLHRFVHDLRL